MEKQCSERREGARGEERKEEEEAEGKKVLKAIYFCPAYYEAELMCLD